MIKSKNKCRQEMEERSELVSTKKHVGTGHCKKKKGRICMKKTSLML